jgi:hypothetical protein
MKFDAFCFAVKDVLSPDGQWRSYCHDEEEAEGRASEEGKGGNTGLIPAPVPRSA